jgi:hypothetical protein
MLYYRAVKVNCDDHFVVTIKVESLTINNYGLTIKGYSLFPHLSPLIILIVDVGFEEFGGAGGVVGLDVEVGYGGGDEATVAFGEADDGVFLGWHDSAAEALGALDADGAVALQAHICYEGVVLVELAVEGTVYLE